MSPEYPQLLADGLVESLISPGQGHLRSPNLQRCQYSPSFVIDASRKGILPGAVLTNHPEHREIINPQHVGPEA